jgi:hypothetical protein
LNPSYRHLPKATLHFVEASPHFATAGTDPNQSFGDKVKTGVLSQIARFNLGHKFPQLPAILMIVCANLSG